MKHLHQEALSKRLPDSTGNFANTKTAIETRSGTAFDVIQPKASAVAITDIAHALSNNCRYNGQCAEFYSVAQHSIIVSHLVDPLYAFAGLMHDAAEAYLSDLCRPAKCAPELSAYVVIEDRIQDAVWEHFGYVFTEEVMRAVKAADNALLYSEAHAIMTNAHLWGWPEGMTGADFSPFPHLAIRGPDDCWLPKKARYEFMRRFNQLCDS